MPGQSRPGSNGNEGVLRISQSPSINWTSPSDCLVSYPGCSLGWVSYPSAEVQSVYSTAPANWARVLIYVRDYRYWPESQTFQDCQVPYYRSPVFTSSMFAQENGKELKRKINFTSVRQSPGRHGFNSRSSHTKDSKNCTWCLFA